MGFVSLILRVLAALILFLLAFEVITSDVFLWMWGALGTYITATIFGAEPLVGIGVLDSRRERR